MVRLEGPGQDSRAGVCAGARQEVKATPKVVSLWGREADLLLQPSTVHSPSILAGTEDVLAQAPDALALPFAPGVRAWPEEHGCSLPVPGRAGDTAWEGASLGKHVLLQRPEDLTASKRVGCSQGRLVQVK